MLCYAIGIPCCRTCRRGAARGEAQVRRMRQGRIIANGDARARALLNWPRGSCSEVLV